MQGAFQFDQPIFLGDPKKVTSIFVGFDAIPIAIEKFDVSVRIFSCGCCYCISIRSCSSRESARVPLCSTSNSKQEVGRSSWVDISSGFSYMEGNFDVMIIQGEKLELCYDPVWDCKCDNTTSTHVRYSGASCYSTTGQSFEER
jgi:hypothetical protein